MKPQSQARRILLVEDEPADALLIQRALTRAGFVGQVEHAADADLALAWLRQHTEEHELPSLVLLDLKLPGMFGLELLDEIRKQPNLRQIPIVVLTGSSDSQTINCAYERGANSYLIKSPDPHEVNRLKSFLQQYWLHVNQSASPRTQRPIAVGRA
jgi:CheY-like chemotaxis protein